MPVFLLFLVKGLYSGSQDQTNQARDIHFFVLPKWSRKLKRETSWIIIHRFLLQIPYVPWIPLAILVNSSFLSSTSPRGLNYISRGPSPSTQKHQTVWYLLSTQYHLLNKSPARSQNMNYSECQVLFTHLPLQQIWTTNFQALFQVLKENLGGATKKFAFMEFIAQWRKLKNKYNE